MGTIGPHGLALRPKAANAGLWLRSEVRADWQLCGYSGDGPCAAFTKCQMTNKPLGSVALVAPPSQLERAVRCDGGD